MESRREGDPRAPFWMPWGIGRWAGKAFLYLLLLLLFILLFTLPRCSDGRGPVPPVLPEDTTIVSPRGDTLRGKMPILYDPENPREGRQPRQGDRPGRKADWPVDVPEDGRDPALPDPNDNQIPPADPRSVRTDPRTGRGVDEAHLLVVLDSDAGDETFNRFASELSSVYEPEVCSIAYYNTQTKLLVLEVKPAQREAIKNELPSRIPDIDFYVCDIEVIAGNARLPDDPIFRYPELAWHYVPVQAPEAWEISTGRSDVVVAVVDSYFQLDHPDLKNVRVVSPFSIENGTDNVYPPSGTDTGSLIHGTHVAGIILGTMGNREGACGIAPGCTFMPVSLGQTLTTASMIEGILYAVYKGASVINVSMGLQVDERTASRLSIEQQIEIARRANLEQEHLWNYVFKLCNERNVTIVWSAGNDNVLSLMDDSKRDSTTVKVEALDRNLRKAFFSNFGTVSEFGVQGSTISAPGTEIVSTIPFGDYAPLDGTSMAAPIVTGAVALMKSVNSTLTNEEIIRILKETAKPIPDESIGDLLQIRAALDKVREGFMRFDDVMRDHNLLLGKWITTRQMRIVVKEGESVVPTGEMSYSYFTFNTTSSGIHEIEIISGERTGQVWKSDVSVYFTRDRIDMRDRLAPISDDGSKMAANVYQCHPDSTGLLYVHRPSNGVFDETYFYLRKIE